MKTIRAIYIDPFNKLVTEIQLPANQDKRDREVRRLMQVPNLDWNTLGHTLDGVGVQFVCDDFGALPASHGGPANQRYFKFEEPFRVEQPIGGRVILLGYNEEGETIDVPLEFGQLRVSWPNVRAVGIQEGEGRTQHPIFGEMFTITRRIIFEDGPSEAGSDPGPNQRSDN